MDAGYPSGIPRLRLTRGGTVGLEAPGSDAPIFVAGAAATVATEGAVRAAVEAALSVV